MNLHYPRAVLAALRGGSGKTTLSLGMIAAYKKLGRRVVPFKKGPDFIDAGWLAYAAGRPCYNLDSFLVETKKTLDSFLTHAEPEGLAIIEGNRGLFDGMDAHGTHSTAELAKLIQAPVLLIADCTKSTRTVAAMVLGCLHLDSSVRIGGVILNMVGTARHERLVRNTVEEARPGNPFGRGVQVTLLSIPTLQSRHRRLACVKPLDGYRDNLRNLGLAQRCLSSSGQSPCFLPPCPFML